MRRDRAGMPDTGVLNLFAWSNSLREITYRPLEVCRDLDLDDCLLNQDVADVLGLRSFSLAARTFTGWPMETSGAIAPGHRDKLD
jgi:hypothetical protein